MLFRSLMVHEIKPIAVDPDSHSFQDPETASLKGYYTGSDLDRDSDPDQRKETDLDPKQCAPNQQL